MNENLCWRVVCAFTAVHYWVHEKVWRRRKMRKIARFRTSGVSVLKGVTHIAPEKQVIHKLVHMIYTIEGFCIPAGTQIRAVRVSSSGMTTVTVFEAWLDDYFDGDWESCSTTDEIQYEVTVNR